MKRTLIAGLCCLASLTTLAQDDFEFAKPTSTEFEMKNYDRDTSANAVVLREYGRAFISSVDGNLVYNYHVRIKVFNSKGFSKGEIAIPIQDQSGDLFEKISEIRGVTFYPDDKGLIQKTDLDKTQVFKEKKAGKYHNLVKFVLPNLRPGSIIEYAYQIESPFVFNFRTWEFQDDIPKIYSEFSPSIPAIYNYNISLRGPYKLTKQDGKLEKECYSPGGGFKADCSRMIYAMEHIPAFKEEAFMTAASNYKAAMYFELSDYVNFYGTKIQVTKEWKDVDHELKTYESFGSQLKKKDFFKDNIPAKIIAISNEKEKAKAIFEFFQSWFKWNNYYGKYSESIKKAFDSHSGSSADINLGLIAAMNASGLNAEPVLLSTRDNGLVNNLFPILSDFDYVVCKVNIGDTYYLLDATDPLVSFGLLPLRCINDRGRVVPFSKPSYWIDLKASQKESKTITVQLTIGENGKASGTISIFSVGYEALEKRKKIKKFNSTDAYVENLDENLTKIKILKPTITNLDSLDLTLSEIYEVEIDVSDKSDKDRLHLNPFFIDKLAENPFKLQERTYPVDLGAASETKIIMQIEFPEKFELANKPDDLGLALPNGGGRFLCAVTVDGKSVAFMNHRQLNKAIYSTEEYHYLKELYNKILQSQQIDLVFKKKI